MYQICIYNYDTNLEWKILKEIENIIESEDYFVSKNWEGGPHIQIVSKKYPSEDMMLELKENLNGIFKLSRISKEEENKTKNIYQKGQKKMANLEQKSSVRDIRAHGIVEILEYNFFYHSKKLTELYIGERIRSHKLLMKTRKLIEDEEVLTDMLFPVIFSKISNIYKENEKNKGYFSYVSHVQGFFELSKKQEKPFCEEQFEKVYQEKCEAMRKTKIKYLEVIEEWFDYFRGCYEAYLQQLNELVDDSYYEELSVAVSQMEGKFNNEFHKNFVRYSKEINFTRNPKATAYRITINLLYLLLPFFNISALKKQIYIYMAYRDVEEQKRLTWREELKIVN